MEQLLFLVATPFDLLNGMVNHSYHRALHCFALLRFNSDATRAHCCLPYFITAALRTSSSEFFHIPPLMNTHTMMQIRFYNNETPFVEGDADFGGGGGSPLRRKSSKLLKSVFLDLVCRSTFTPRY